MSSNYGYTGEMEDENGLVNLRARYYNRDTGTFLSRDPDEGNVNDPMSLNEYAYAHGNPVNNTDPSGLCVESDPDVMQCHQDVNFLTLHGFFVLWDENRLSRVPEEMCLQANVALNINSAEKLKWDADEVRALRNTVNILNKAYRSLDDFKENYILPVKPPASLVKVNSLSPEPPPTPTPVPNITPTPAPGSLKVAGKTFADARIIALSQDGWSILQNQERSWIFLHEFGHLLLDDLGKVRTGINQRDVYESELASDVYFNNEYNIWHISKYSYTSSSEVEYMIEALTGTLWNYGYSAVQGYESNAGGRTGYATLAEHLEKGSTTYRRRVGNQTITDSVVNVRLNPLDERSDLTLEDWIIKHIINGEPIGG